MPRVLTTSTASTASTVSTTSTAAAARTARASLRFDAHSVLLFALWAGAGLAAHDARAQAVAEPAARSAPVLGAVPAVPAAPQPASPAAATSPAAASGTIEAAFARADANGDGQLTRDEAARYPAVAQAFDGMDTDRSGALSQTEFVTSVRFGAQRSPATPAPQGARPAGG